MGTVDVNNSNSNDSDFDHMRNDREFPEDMNTEVYDVRRKVFYFRAMRATTLPFNKRITLPPALEDRQMELELQTLKEKMIERTKLYARETKTKGIKTYPNKSQKDGIVTKTC